MPARVVYAIVLHAFDIEIDTRTPDTGIVVCHFAFRPSLLQMHRNASNGGRFF